MHEIVRINFNARELLVILEAAFVTLDNHGTFCDLIDSLGLSEEQGVELTNKLYRVLSHITTTLEQESNHAKV